MINVKLAPSAVHGVGVFAITNISAGTHFMYSPDNEQIPILKESIESDPCIPENVKKFIRETFPNGGTYRLLPVCGLNNRGITTYINHSNTPNVQTINFLHHVVALRDIKAGEELFSDYGETYVPKIENYSKKKEDRYLQSLRK